MSLRWLELPCHGRLLLQVDRGVALKSTTTAACVSNEGRLRPFRFSRRNSARQRIAICVNAIPIVS